jgi:hypothetical protein
MPMKKLIPTTFYKFPAYNTEGIHYRQNPPLQKGRIAGQLAGGALAGLVTGTAFVLIVPCYDLDCHHPLVLGYTFGMSQAIYRIGTMTDLSSTKSRGKNFHISGSFRSMQSDSVIPVNRVPLLNISIPPF